MVLMKLFAEQQGRHRLRHGAGGGRSGWDVWRQ